MFSKTCEYAIRAMLYIAGKFSEGRRLGIKEIAKGIDCPEHFIAKILQELVRHRLVFSAKGPNGGFFLDKKLLSCSLADIVRAIDGDKLFSGCGLGLKQCSEIRPCPLHHEFKKLRTDTFLLLSKSKLGEFNEQLGKSMTFLSRN